MATLSQIRSRVSRKIKDPDNTAVSAADVDFEINRAVRFYSPYRFWFNESETSITLVADQQTIPSIPTDLVYELQVNGIRLTDDQIEIDLIKLLPDEFWERDDESTGRPYFYTYQNGSYYLQPTPNEAYTVTFRYIKSYSDLSNDADTNDFTDNAEDLMMLHAVKNIYAEDKEDSNRALFYQQLEDQEYKRLTKQTDGRNSTGLIYNHSILETYYI